MKPKILLVEDEIDLGNVVKQYLEVMDFDVDWCTNGKEAFKKFRSSPSLYNILLIDVCLPEMDGFNLASNILKINDNISFLFLTARAEKKDKIFGLKIGADDYITKPFEIDEVVLRIKNILKRNHGNPSHNQSKITVIQVGNISFSKELLKLTIDNNKEILLTTRECELLNYLFQHPNRILKREEILTQLWGENDYFLGRSLDVFISRLRKYIGHNEYISITNIYGVGFVFNVKNTSEQVFVNKEDGNLARN
ncbi:MAG TPA: response regulator transcription factor [Chitinophagaceae bacterium]